MDGSLGPEAELFELGVEWAGAFFMIGGVGFSLV